MSAKESQTPHPQRLEIHCPSCHSAIDEERGQPEIVCTVCTMRFQLAGRLCPACAKYHEDEQAICLECGTALIRLCRRCQSVNWTGDDLCIHCGEAIDLLSQVEAKSRQSTSDRLDQQMWDAKDLKAIESQASDRRMAELMAIEEARQAELRRQSAAHQRQERQMLIVVFAAVLLFFIVLIGYAIMSQTL